MNRFATRAVTGNISIRTSPVVLQLPATLDRFAPGTLNNILKQAGLKENSDALRRGDRKGEWKLFGVCAGSAGLRGNGQNCLRCEEEIRAAIRFHIEGLEADALDVPTPTSIADYVEA